MFKFVKAALAVGLSAACVLSLAGCSSTTEETDTSGLIAVSINGVEITEDEVTAYIESLRTTYSLEDDDVWGENLAYSEMTAEEFRLEIIDSYIAREIIDQFASERGVEIDETEVDYYVDSAKSYYETDEEWEAALESAGLTEEEYRFEIQLQLKDMYLAETFEEEGEISEADQLSYALMYATGYDGAKRSSHILLSTDDEEAAQAILDQINSGEISFEEAAELYSLDTGSSDEGGDIGWDKTLSLVDEYQVALDELEVGEVSELVESTYGYHIILCTDEFIAPTTVDDDGDETITITSTDQIPSEWLEEINSSLLSQIQIAAYYAWIDEMCEVSDIVIYDMPSGLSYDVDVSLYLTSDY